MAQSRDPKTSCMWEQTNVFSVKLCAVYPAISSSEHMQKSYKCLKLSLHGNENLICTHSLKATLKRELNTGTRRCQILMIISLFLVMSILRDLFLP